MADQTETLKKLFLRLKQIEAELEKYKKASHEPIAVIGMSCRFPGGVESPEDFWELIVNGRDAVDTVPMDRWNVSRFYDEDPELEGKMYVKKGGFLSGDLGLFDNQFFSINPDEAEAMDPQHRYLLETSYEAFQNAGIPIENLKGSGTGVFVGISNSDYAQLNWRWGQFNDSNAYSLTGTALSTAAGRISYMYGLEGPNFAVDTACSSSLVALHNACMSLRNGESNMALAGGVNMILAPEAHIAFCKMNALSKDGHCKPFDQSANGFIRSEGCGWVVLKRLSDAERDGDRILGLVRGSAINQDGLSNGLTAPSGKAQEKVILSALKNAQVEPESISYVEAHGTGTPLGDPIEVEALTAVLSEKNDACWLGSVKANIGHAESAAGMAGFIKSILMMQHQTIPQQIHFNEPSQYIDWSTGKLTVPTKNERWDSELRRSGLSSFGFGGTNAHVILEEYKPDSSSNEAEKRPELLMLSAKSIGALKELAGKYSKYRSNTSPDELRAIAYSSIYRQSLLDKRAVFVADSWSELADNLSAFSLEKENAGKFVSNVLSKHKVAFVFSGQGGQWQGMGRDLYATSEVFKTFIDTCDTAFSKHVSWSLKEMIQQDWQEMAAMGSIQPMLFAIQVGIARWWQDKGIEPAAIVGQSMGEVAAHYVAGALTLEDAATIICKRSQLLEREEGKGAMALIQLPSDDVLKRIENINDRVSIAVDSSPHSTVVAGESEAVLSLIEQLEEENVFVKKIKANVASHSPLMNALRGDLTEALKVVQPQEEIVVIYSSVKAESISGLELTGDYWVDNLREPVRLRETVGKMLEDGCSTFIEISPHPVLEQNLEQCFEAYEKNALAIPSMWRDENENASLLKNLGVLHASGHPVNWEWYFPEGEKFVQLPSYPWQKKRFWTDKPNYWPVQGAIEGSKMTYSYNWVESTVEGSEKVHGHWFILTDPEFNSTDFVLKKNENHTIVQSKSEIESIERSEDDRFVRCYQLDDSKELVEENERVFEDLLSWSKYIISSEWCFAVVISGSKKFNPVLQAVQAFIRSLALEKPGSDALVSFLIDEPTSSNEDAILSKDVVKLEGGKSFEPVIEPTKLQGNMPEFKSDRSYLVTGGFGSLGTYFTEWLIDKGAKHIVFTTRNAFPEKSEWEQSQDARVKQLLAWREKGVEISVFQSDLVNENTVRNIFDACQQKDKSIAGIIHAAGAISEVDIASLTSDDRKRIHAPKTKGAWTLHNISLEYEVDFMLLNSSVSAVWGSSGLAHYASANAFLDGLANLRNEMGHQTLSVNWGSWGGSTMATGDKGERLNSLGIRTSSKEDMLKELDAAFYSGLSHVMIADMDWESFLPLMELSGKKRLFDLLRGVSESDDLNAEKPIMKELISAGSFGLENRVSAYIKKMVSEYLGTEDAELDVNLGFFKMGFTSISAVSLMKRLKSELGMDLPSTLTFDYPSIMQLSDYLTKELLETHFEKEEVTTEVVEDEEDLSFEELKRMMEEELGSA